MTRVLFYTVILLASVWLGLKIAASPGYVLISYQQLAVETTLWFALIATLLSFVLAYFLLRLFSGAISAPVKIRHWWQRRQKRKARRLTQQGMRALVEGNFTAAEKSLIKSLPESETPLLNYLMAANAAQGNHEIGQRDEYLRQALQCAEGAEVAVGLTQAKLQLDTKQLEQAVATLEHLHGLEPKNKQVLQLLQRVYSELEDWNGLQDILAKLRKQKVLQPNVLHELEQQVTLALMKISAPRLNVDELHKAWKKVPKALQVDPEMVVYYCDALEGHGEHAEAEKIIRKALSVHWDARLIRRYGRIKSPNPAKQLHIAENWLKNHPDDPDLLICLGQLCLENKLWGKARSSFEHAIHLEPSVPTLRNLGHVYEALDDKELALDCYRRAVDLCLEK